MLHVRSTVRLEQDDRIRINASDESTAPIKALRLRNAFGKHQGKLAFSGLVGEAWGLAEAPEDAVETLTPRASQFLDAVAVAGNACVDEPARLLVYAPPTDDDVGRFLEQRPCDPWSPAAKVRSVGMRDLRTVIEGIDGHPDSDRIHRAIAHYADALRHLDPLNRLRSGEHLWMACENLGQVILRRRCREVSLPCEPSSALGESKHKLAVDAGFNPVGDSRQHLNDFDAQLRVDEIFAGDRKTYRLLKKASDGLEHGYASFGEAQSLAEASADAAFGLVRSSVLREIGVDGKSALNGGRYEHPLAGWQPVHNVTGTYTASEPEAEWPHFYGANLTPEIQTIEDLDDDTRNVTFEVNASGGSLLAGQTLSIETTSWTIAGTPGDRLDRVDGPTVQIRRGTGSSSKPEED
jgi:hypothetical protein